MNLLTKSFHHLLLSHSHILSRGHDQRLSLSYPNSFLRELLSSDTPIADSDSQVFSAFCKDIYARYGYGLDFAGALYIDAFMYFSKLRAAGYEFNRVKDDIKALEQKLKHLLHKGKDLASWDVEMQLNSLPQDVCSAVKEYLRLSKADSIASVKRSAIDHISVSESQCIRFKADPLSWHVSNKYLGGTTFNNPQVVLVSAKLCPEALATLLSRVCETGRELVIIGKTPTPLALEIFHANLDNIPMLWVVPVVGMESSRDFYTNLAVSLGGSVSDEISLGCSEANIIANLGTCESLSYDLEHISINPSGYLKEDAIAYVAKLKQDLKDNPNGALGLLQQRVEIEVGAKTSVDAEIRYFEILEAVRTLDAIRKTGWISKQDLLMTLTTGVPASGLRNCIVANVERFSGDFPIEMEELALHAMNSALFLAWSEKCIISE